MDIYLKCRTKREHISQIITGFLELESEDIKVHIINETNNNSKFQKIPILEVTVNDKLIIYDCEDGYPFREDWMLYYLPKCDFYFKRSFSKKINAERYAEYESKIFPLGLNFFVTCKKNPYNFKYKSFKEKIRLILKNLFTFDGLYVEKRYTDYVGHQNGVIFMTRLWEPNSKDKKINDHRNKINNERIELIRALKNEFGQDFFGGIERSKLAEELAPDLILSKRWTQKKNYLLLMKRARIGIATTGLHNSIGWKFCEYLAAGLAIVSEKLNYEVPGGFCEGIYGNYLEYSSVEECVEKVSLLMNNDNIGLCNDMMKRNKKYYEEYVSPKFCVENTLKKMELI